MFCRKCGIKFDDNSTFCPECGEMAEAKEESSEGTSVQKQTNIPAALQKPFREDFFEHIKGVSFLLLVISGLIYYGINILNEILHFSTSDIFVSIVSIIYGLTAFGLIVPALWMIYLDRSPHSAFVPIRLYAFINLLKLLLITAFGILTVTAVIMGKEDISKPILYLADGNLSLYLVTLLSQTAKNPSVMLISTSTVLWVTYLMSNLMYHISLIRLLSTTSARINNNETVPRGYSVISSISFFVSALNFVYALSMYLFLKDDIYNVLFAVFKGIFHMMVFFDLRKYGRVFIVDEESEDMTQEE